MASAMTTLRLGLLLMVSMQLAACGAPARNLPVESSANQISYATSFPDDLAATRGRFAEQESRATRQMGEMAVFTDGVDAKDWSLVAQAYQIAGDEGATTAYVTRREETDAVEEFFDSEKDKLSQSLAGSVAYTAKQHECKEPADIGAVAWATLDKTFDKELERQLRAASEAQSFVDRHADAIGRSHIEELRRQLDELSSIAYTVKIGVERTRLHLQTLLDDASAVSQTLNRAAAQLQEDAENTAIPEADRKAAQTRAKDCQTAAARMDGEVQQGRYMADQMDSRIGKLRKDFENALAALVKAANDKGAAPSS